MAKMSMASIDFNKDYLESIYKKIKNHQKIVFIQQSKVYEKEVKLSDQIQKLLIFIERKDVEEVKSILKSKMFNYIFETDEKIFKFTDIDKSQFTKIKSKVSTREQEICSLECIKFGLENKEAGFESFKTELYSKLYSIYPDIDDEWLETFYKQQKAIKSYFGLSCPKFGHYSRDGGFMEFVENLTKKFNIQKKDTWNPADIWLVKDLEEAKNKINLQLEKDFSIKSLNKIMRKLLKDQEVIGISLKKISYDEAKIEVIMNDSVVKSDYVISSQRCILNIDNSTGKFKSTDYIIECTDGSKKASIQIRQNSRGFSNLKFEASSKSEKARMGKVPLLMLKDLFETYNINVPNNHKLYPKSYNCIKEEHFDLVKECFLHTHVNFSEEHKNLIDNFKICFHNHPDIASSKIMQLSFLNEINKLDEDQRNKLINEMLNLSQKKGPIFGPFIKLY